MASTKNKMVSEKVHEIKRMQKNWMNQRASLNDTDLEKTSSAQRRHGRSQGTRPKTKNSDTVSWVIGGGAKKKPTTVRAHSASPARQVESKPAWGASNSRPSSGKVRSQATDGRPPTSGRSSSGRLPSANHPTSSRSDSSSTTKLKSQGNHNEHATREGMVHSGSEPSLYHRGVSEENSKLCDTSSQPNSRTDQLSASNLKTDQSSGLKSNTDQWDFSKERTSSQSESPIRDTVLSEEAVHLNQSTSKQISQPNESVDPAVQLESRTRDLIGPDSFDKLADQIASKVRADLKHERTHMMQSVGYTGKSVLEDEDYDAKSVLASHKCSKCKQLMVAPDHIPTVLIPCGHTLCEACAEDRIKCPTCRARVSSSTKNTTLEHVISAAISKPTHKAEPSQHQLYDPLEYSSHPPPTLNPSSAELHHSENRGAQQERREINPAYDESRNDCDSKGNRHLKGAELPRGTERRKLSPKEQAEKYHNEYQNLLIRCEAMEGEEEEILAAVERKNREIAKQKKQISNIANEQDRLREEVRKIEGRIGTLDTHRREYDNQCKGLEEDKLEHTDRLAMVRDMLRGLERNKEKVKLLARNYDVSLD